MDTGMACSATLPRAPLPPGMPTPDFTLTHPTGNPNLGVKGIGEIGITGVVVAVANAVYHATGKRVRDLPITLDKVMA